MEIRVGKIIGICFAVSMILVGSSFLVINMVSNHQNLSAGSNATYDAVRFAPIGYHWSGTKLIDDYDFAKPLCRIYDIIREPYDGENSKANKIDLNVDNPA